MAVTEVSDADGGQSEAERPLRSYLYVPGHRADLVLKAFASEADAVVVDLEDGVPPAAKRSAREQLAELSQIAGAKPALVRVNSVASSFISDDLAAVASLPLDRLRVAKVESADEVREVAGELDRLGSTLHFHCILESALGVERAFEIASADRRVCGLALGEVDFAADVHAHGEWGLLHARSRVVVAARAARLPPPVLSVHADLADLDGLRASTEHGKQLGFFGRAAIHPAQLSVINRVFTPTAEEVRRARDVVAGMAEATVSGDAAIALADGRFVDPPVARAAEQTLALAAALDHKETRAS